jgi:hypothetical protein
MTDRKPLAISSADFDRDPGAAFDASKTGPVYVVGKDGRMALCIRRQYEPLYCDPGDRVPPEIFDGTVAELALEAARLRRYVQELEAERERCAAAPVKRADWHAGLERLPIDRVTKRK